MDNDIRQAAHTHYASFIYDFKENNQKTEIIPEISRDAICESFDMIPNMLVSTDGKMKT